MPSDRDLVTQIRNHDARAFELLFERYEDTMRRHLMRFVRDKAAAQDLLQETFLRVWTRAEQWNGSGSFRAWLYRIGTNLALNHLRSVRRRREQPLATADEWDADGEESRFPAWMIDASALGPDTVIEIAEQHRIVRHLLETLPEEKREVFRLVHEMEMSMRDVADELGIPEGTVKSRLHYAKKHLAREWQDLETD
jgi:RNA polymerase sigma-70 factor (ECF subfamily)